MKRSNPTSNKIHKMKNWMEMPTRLSPAGTIMTPDAAENHKRVQP